MQSHRKPSPRRSPGVQSPFSNTARSANTVNYYGLEGKEKAKSTDGPSSRRSIPRPKLVKAPRFFSVDYSSPAKKDELVLEEEDSQSRSWDSTVVLLVIFTALALLLLIIIFVYIYLGTLIYSNEYHTTIRRSDFYFDVDPLNFSDAMEACNQRRMGLALLFSEQEENDFFNKIYSNRTIMDKCPSVFIGYRIAPDKEWHGPKNETAFGAMFSDMWEQTTYDLELETCSQAIKVAGYKLNNVVCNFPNDCAVCETESHCPNHEPICFFLERIFPKVNHSMAEDVCASNYNGQLALIRSEALRIMLTDLLAREDPLHVCKAVAVGMQLKRQVETVHGLTMAYKSTRLKLNQGDAMDYCLSAKTRENDVGILSTQSCTDRACYACRK